ncbi:MAG TPA: hypothetical protein VFU47_05145, partial [Armatimonadota bacterium]|nr:hypothetical protein [Armatimonadota bacterium]
PAIDRGQLQAEALVDIEGRARPAGAAADVGCCEAAGASAPPPPTAALAGISVSPGTVTGGSSASGTITLATASSADVTVTLSASGPASVPRSVTIPAGAARATFSFSTAAVPADTEIVLTASLNGASRTADLAVLPPGFSAFSVSPAAVVGGRTATGTLTLSGPAPQGGLSVTLMANSPAARLPATVTIPAGSRSATFSIATTAVRKATAVLVTARVGAASRSARLSIRRG